MLILKNFKISLQVAFFFHQVLYMYFLWTQDSDHITIPNYSKNLLFKKKKKLKIPFPFVSFSVYLLNCLNTLFNHVLETVLVTLTKTINF